MQPVPARPLWTSTAFEAVRRDAAKMMKQFSGKNMKKLQKKMGRMPGGFGGMGGFPGF